MRRGWTELAASLEQALAVHPPDLRALDLAALDLDDPDLGGLGAVVLLLQDAPDVDAHLDLVDVAVHGASEVGDEHLGLGFHGDDPLRVGSPLVRAAVAARLVAWALAGPDDAGACARAPLVPAPQRRPLELNWDAIGPDTRGPIDPSRRVDAAGVGAAHSPRFALALAFGLIVAMAVLLSG